jgi:Asp-tRNA(Asn)/Glu-tRNA(Gln) amidotransferase A subunit family amidase
MGAGSVGSDTRGSIRIPAACCGITGLKPTYGAVDTDDVLPLAASLDHLGPMTRSAEDAALLFAAMAGGPAGERALQLLAAYSALFRKIDCLAGATLPVPAPPAGVLQLKFAGQDTHIAEVLCRYTAAQNLTGVPALSLPCGFTRSGLPISLQLIAGHGREDVVLGLGAAYQRATDWHERRPKLP